MDVTAILQNVKPQHWRAGNTIGLNARYYGHKIGLTFKLNTFNEKLFN